MSSNASEEQPPNVVEPQTVEDSIEEPLIPLGSVVRAEPEPGKTLFRCIFHRYNLLIKQQLQF
jgi:hypothetical protein